MRIPLICTTPQGLYSSSLSRWLRQSLLLFLPQEWLSWLHPSWLPGMNSPLHNSLFQRRAQDPAAELALQGIGSTGVWFSFEYFVDFVLDFFVLFCELRFYSIAQAGLVLTIQPRLSSNSPSSCLWLPDADVLSMCHPAVSAWLGCLIFPQSFLHRCLLNGDFARKAGTF